jgi:hypothetical protein
MRALTKKQRVKMSLDALNSTAHCVVSAYGKLTAAKGEVRRLESLLSDLQTRYYRDLANYQRAMRSKP